MFSHIRRAVLFPILEPFIAVLAFDHSLRLIYPKMQPNCTFLFLVVCVLVQFVSVKLQEFTKKLNSSQFFESLFSFWIFIHFSLLVLFFIFRMFSFQMPDQIGCDTVRNLQCLWANPAFHQILAVLKPLNQFKVIKDWIFPGFTW